MKVLGRAWLLPMVEVYKGVRITCRGGLVELRGYSTVTWWDGCRCVLLTRRIFPPISLPLSLNCLFLFSSTTNSLLTLNWSKLMVEWSLQILGIICWGLIFELKDKRGSRTIHTIPLFSNTFIKISMSSLPVLQIELPFAGGNSAGDYWADKRYFHYIRGSLSVFGFATAVVKWVPDDVIFQIHLKPSPFC